MSLLRTVVAVAALLAISVPPSQLPVAAAAASSGCHLANGIEHVFYIQFDNLHLRRDRPDVASDLEQMPHLLSFMRDNGTLLSNDHTILIAHTGGGFVTSLTGLYPDRNGFTVSNAYGYFSGVGANGISMTTGFKYWTDPVDDVRTPSTDPRPNMITDTGKTTPAPWVPFTRAGCDVGGVGFANIELENTGTGPAGDMTQVFGSGSDEWNAADSAAALPKTPDTARARAQPSADYVGLAVHCAQGGICDAAAGARPDLLPDEPAGYVNFNALFGAKYIDPILTGQPSSTPVMDLSGNPIVDAEGNPGFPGFDAMAPRVSLAYAAALQEAGVPVTYAYISDAHDSHPATGLSQAFGPGEPAYVQQLQAYDQAFADFFDNLAAHGITRDNSVFVFTADEGDHFAGGSSSDGTWAHQFCDVSVSNPSCPPNQIGEIAANVAGLLPSDPNRPAFMIHNDSAPTFYLSGQPARDNAAVRSMERDISRITLPDPYTNESASHLALQMADPVGEQVLHMVNADPLRTPTFTVFANPDVYVTTSDMKCPTEPVRVCVAFYSAWIHGDNAPEIANTWLGMVGPGVKRAGEDDVTWADHTDARPTLLALVGLQDDYHPDGRVLLQALDGSSLSDDVRALGDVYKQLNAPFGQFGQDSLAASTAALQSGSDGDDTRYASIEARLTDLGSRRDVVAARMRDDLFAAEFTGASLDPRQVRRDLEDAEELLGQMNTLAAQTLS